MIGAEHVAALEERGRDDRVDVAVAHERIAFLGVVEAVVVQVVAGDLDDPVGDGQPGHAGLRVDVDVGQDDAIDAGLVVVPMGPRAVEFGQADEVEHRAVGPEQAVGGLGDGLQDLALVAHRADPRGDLAQGPLGVGGAGQVRPGRGQLADEPGVGDGDGRLAGEGTDEVGVGFLEGVALDGVHLDDAERSIVARDRRRDHRVEPGAFVELGRLGARREQGVELVAGDDDAVLGDGDAGRALADRDPQLCPLLVREQAGEPVVERPAQLVGAGLEQVEDGALPADQPAGQLDDLLEDVGRVAQRGDARGDLAQGLLGLGPAGESRARAVELVDELGAGDGDGRLGGDRVEDVGVRPGPRRRARR